MTLRNEFMIQDARLVSRFMIVRMQTSSYFIRYSFIMHAGRVSGI